MRNVVDPEPPCQICQQTRARIYVRKSLSIFLPHHSVFVKLGISVTQAISRLIRLLLFLILQQKQWRTKASSLKSANNRWYRGLLLWSPINLKRFQLGFTVFQAKVPKGIKSIQIWCRRKPCQRQTSWQWLILLGQSNSLRLVKLFTWP